MSINLVYYDENFNLDDESEGMLAVGWAKINDDYVVVSRFKDLVWNISCLFGQSNIEPSNMKIDWNTIPIRQRHLWKSYMYAVMRELQNKSHRKGSNKLSGGTVITKFDVVRDFSAKFVVNHSINSILDLANNKLSRQNRIGLIDAYIKESNNSNNADYVRRRLEVLSKLYIFKKRGLMSQGFSEPLINIGVNSYNNYIHDHLLREETKRKKHGYASTKEIPDVIMEKIAVLIDTWINDSDRILGAMEDYVNIGLQDKCEGLFSAERDVLLKPFLAKWNFSSRNELRRFFINLYKACVAALYNYTGFRDNEVLDIKIDGYRKYDDKNGRTHYYISTMIRKTSKDKNGTFHERPTSKAAYEAANILNKMTLNARDNLYIEIEKAEKLLETLTPETERYNEIAIAISEGNKHRNKLLLSLKKRCHHIYKNNKNSNGQDTPTPMLPYGINADAGSSLTAWFKTMDISHTSINFNEPWHFTPHQARRSLARYVAKYIRQDPYIVKWLLGHKGAFMSEFYMKGDPDEELLRWIEDEIFFQNSGVIENALINQQPLAGTTGRRIMKLRDSLAFKSAKEIADDLALGSLLIFNGHSWCYAEHGQEPCDFSECVMQPSKCVDCPKTLITEQMLPLWQTMYATTFKMLDYIDDQKIKEAHKKVIEKYKKVIETFEPV